MRSKILFPLILSYCIISCKKDNTSTNSNTNKLKMYIEDARNTPLNVIDSFSITYDNNNRIVGLASPNLKTVYTYNANTSFTMDLYVNNQLNIHEIGWVNGNLLVDSTFQYNNANDSSTEKYTYSGKLLTRKSTYLYSAVTGSQLDTQDDYSYDNNGNAVKDIQSDGNGNVYIISTLTYTNQLLNYSISAPYFVPLSKNLPATEVQTDGSGNAIGSVNITYVYDNSGRVTKETDALDNGYVVVKSYIYFT